ncbi:hypothetical protein ACKI16_29535 [Streptomyces scabiei]|uniref:hypothetical protein n=1 Tax=Streptomyces scabiei TaxID=1930 RepID=UPI0038F7FABC
MTTALYRLTEDVPLGDLTPYPGNAKAGDVPTILESLRRNGQYRSLVVRRVGSARVILAGNHTAQALTVHGPGDCGRTVRTADGERPCGVCGNSPAWEQVARVEIIECDEPTARRINLVDNRSAERGTWDEAALVDLLGGLDDLDGTAYTSEDYDDLLRAANALTDAAAQTLTALPIARPHAPALPSLHPFSDTAAPTPAHPPAAAPAAPAAVEEPAPEPARPATPPLSPGVHAGPAPYTGPGARTPAGDGVQLPPRVNTVPLQMLLTVDQRDVIHAAMSTAKTAEGLTSAAAALTAICEHYLTTVGDPAADDDPDE